MSVFASTVSVFVCGFTQLLFACPQKTFAVSVFSGTETQNFSAVTAFVWPESVNIRTASVNVGAESINISTEPVNLSVASACIRASTVFERIAA